MNLEYFASWGIGVQNGAFLKQMIGYQILLWDLLCFATDSSSKLLYWLIQKVLEQKRSLLALLNYCRFGDRAINYEKLLPKPRSISWMEASRFLKIAWRQLGL